MHLVNLTQYRIIVTGEGGELMLEPATVPARVRLVVEGGEPAALDGTTVPTITFRHRLDGLPDPRPGVAYLVLSEVAWAAQAAGRPVNDLFLLNPGPRKLARDGSPITLTTLVRPGPPERRP